MLKKDSRQSLIGYQETCHRVYVKKWEYRLGIRKAANGAGAETNGR